MKVLLDINVMLDYLQRRAPFFEEAAAIIDAINYTQIQGALAGHAVTTLHYFLRKGAEPQRVEETLRWLIGAFEIVPADKYTFAKAIDLNMTDYEDAVACQCALNAGCNYIVTRDRRDFTGSPIPPISPTEFLKLIEHH